jgi:hypothetical protein
MWVTEMNGNNLPNVQYYHLLSRFLPFRTAGLSLTIATITFGNARGALPYASPSDGNYPADKAARV